MNKKNGYTLIEVVVSLLLLSIIVMGFFKTYNTISNLNERSEKKRLAFQLCQETISKITEAEIEDESNLLVIKKDELIDYNFRFYSQYRFINELIIKKLALIVDGEKIKDLFIYKILVSWQDQSFEIYTVLGEGGSSN
ncbi:MAG: prepilin-type N-terminal cleavage/methylation domain-containing protein [Halanaerobiales bacterium]|nr:prepilin-type N-terminal cleavage/methylation domain-containing protein [Halanaerobiales bacterium]